MAIVRIEDYAFLSYMESAALVSRHGSIDWLCWPRFDSAACFCALLHDDTAGYWSLRPAGDIQGVDRRYRGDSLVLETRFVCAEGIASVVDCLALNEASVPTDPQQVFPEQVLVRLVRGIEGQVPMRMEYRPRFDYGSVVPWFRERHGVIEAVGGPDALDLSASLELHMDEGGVRRDFCVQAGEEVAFLLSYHQSHKEAPAADPKKALHLIESTERYWKDWAGACSYEGPRRDEVVRSLVTLKGLTYAPSGGIVAAPTASLPETIGGSRNWDYRYCWLRDATFTLDALLDYGYTDAAESWRDWLLRAIAGDPEDMQIMYGVLGERRLLEYELPLDGYAGSRPVRIGNAAHMQFQLDVYGELMDSFHSARRAGIDTPDHAWALEKSIVDHVCERWTEPDDGIWEVRSGPEHFVHSKVMAWVALDRGVKAIEMFGEDADLAHWSSLREEVRADIMAQGVEPHLRRFRRSYGTSELDASLLMLPLVGFIPATDEVMVNTIEAIQHELMSDGFVRRYRTERIEDGLGSREGSFIMCSFWLVDCLILLSRYEEATALFDRVAATSNDLGLMAEQYDPGSKRQLGNFPQAFSHVAHVTSLAALETAGKSRSMRRGES